MQRGTQRHETDLAIEDHRPNLGNVRGIIVRQQDCHQSAYDGYWATLRYSSPWPWLLGVALSLPMWAVFVWLVM
jgi:hypothetical protein